LEQLQNLLQSALLPGTQPSLASRLSLSLTYLNTRLPDYNCRVLVFVNSPDNPPQYVSLMNSAFAAQKLGVRINSVVFSEASWWAQLASLTAGLSSTMKSPQDLVKHLVLHYLSPEPAALSAMGRVDLRATCRCHFEKLSVGFVCSVCFSVFCAQAESCSVCGVKYGEK